MKKLFIGIAIILGTVCFTSCKCQRDVVVEEETVQAVDSTAVEAAVDTTVALPTPEVTE